MSHWLLEKQEERHHAALGIAIAAKVLRQCEWHPDIVMEGDQGVEPSYAYRVGNAKLKGGELGDTFSSPREMTDAVKGVIEEYCLDYCPCCDNLLKD